MKAAMISGNCGEEESLCHIETEKAILQDIYFWYNLINSFHWSIVFLLTMPHCISDRL